MYKRIFLGKEYKLKDEKSKQNFDFFIKKMEGFQGVILAKNKIALRLIEKEDELIEAKILYLFSYLEMIASLEIILKNKKIKSKQTYSNFILSKEFNYKKFLIKFINNFLLNNKNDIYNKDKDFLKRWNGKELLELRNHISHFLSIPDNVMMHNDAALKDEEVRKVIEKNGILKPINPNIFFDLLQNSYELLLRKIVDDYFKGDKKNRKLVRKRLEVASDIYNNSSAKLLNFNPSISKQIK